MCFTFCLVQEGQWQTSKFVHSGACSSQRSCRSWTKYSSPTAASFALGRCDGACLAELVATPQHRCCVMGWPPACSSRSKYSVAAQLTQVPRGWVTLCVRGSMYTECFPEMSVEEGRNRGLFLTACILQGGVKPHEQPFLGLSLED